MNFRAYVKNSFIFVNICGNDKKLLFQEKNQETNQEKYSRKNKEKIEKKLRKKKKLEKNQEKENQEKCMKRKKRKNSKIKYGVHFLRVKIILGQKLTLKSPA